MKFLFALLFCAEVVATAGLGMQCSAACEACCPRDSVSGEWLRQTSSGDCVNDSGVLVCKLATGKCLGGMSARICEEVSHPRIEIDEVMLGEDRGTNTFLADGMRAWNSEHPEGHSALHNIPPFYHGFAALIPHQRLLGAETEVRFMCPEGMGDCEAAVFVYECTPCDAQNGGIPSQLAAGGFERSNCAPTFTTGKKEGLQHPMTAYTRIVGQGQTLTFRTRGSAQWVFFAMGHGASLHCARLQRTDCESHDKIGFCEWNWQSQACRTNTCGQPQQCDPTKCVEREYDSSIVW